MIHAAHTHREKQLNNETGPRAFEKRIWCG